jgi:general secretion pathway protein D
LVIGGLIKRDDSSFNNGVPVLGAIPVLGYFFKRHDFDKSRSELTVFITPHIVRQLKDMSFERTNELLVAEPAQEAPKIKAAAKPEPVAVPVVQSAPRTAPVIQGPEKVIDLDILDGLLSYARGMERDLSVDPSDALYINTELIKTYKQILQQFPDSGRGDYCLYKISEIYAQGFGKCSAAQEAFSRLKEQFPSSSYIGVSQQLIKECEGLADSAKALNQK